MNGCWYSAPSTRWLTPCAYNSRLPLRGSRMDSQLKQRLIGAAVLVALAVVFLPALLKGPDVKEPDAAQVPLSMPATPGEDYETRELPLNAPEANVPANGVLG